MQTEPPKIVIDTQVVMDWLVFGDARIAPLAAAIEAGRINWIGREAMLAELRHVLGRGVAAAWQPDLSRIEQAFSAHCQMVVAEPAPAVRLVCRDPDDQQFIDLALAERAAWLLSRDKAVLALRKRALTFGLTIGTPELWLKSQPA
ncbi:putative toxin-antitoxin system toxin component, PIN family [Roseateles sp. DAIF2]|uniref:putative toxin-antitoxin system toxin component, PIN family n=1 Tax=Roseateles sp. DAIF2 TaxID=2714952 RepID=UPI0018A31C36|nr:putative toxin-antitoxin system toxin component, PIN family [Roseateles sp. DAIF2]QPF72152.1 putative toxin-antitoxin system toxin component, PIN family [Roseateles sp. DAIF2]